MTHAVETMAYAREVPWHGLGFKVSDNLTPAQMLKAAKVDWKVEKRKVSFATAAGGHKIIGEKFALVRTSDENYLSMVGTTYRPVQNEAAFDFFKKYCEAGHMTMETAGSLWDGKYVWCLAKINKDFTLGKGDKVEGYVLLMSPHVHGKSMLIQTTAIRVVCWNTLSMAIGSDLKGKGKHVFRMPHTTEFNDAVKETAAVAVGLAKEQMTEFQEAAQLLTKKKVTPKQTEEFFCEVLHFDPKKGTKKKDGTVREPLMLPRFRAALEHAPGQQINTATGTAWGAFNAVTYVVDHETGRERSTGLKNAWTGHTATIKRRALNLALDLAK